MARPWRFARRILRPSIVIGHSRTLETINPTGIYGFLRKLRAYRGMLARTQASLVREKSLQLRVDAGTEFDLIPIDRVAANAVSIALVRDPPPIRFEDLLDDPEPVLRRFMTYVLRTDREDAGFLARAAQLVHRPASRWQDLEARDRGRLEAACRAGFEALAARGVSWR